MIYDTPRFIYPPRPEVKIMPSMISKYDTPDFIAQPKYNGSCVCVFLDGSSVTVINRHNEPKTRVSGNINFNAAHRGDGWMVLAGELMDKSKIGEAGSIFEGFIIWDILVYSGKYIVGSTLYERINLLNNLYPHNTLLVDDSGKMHELHHVSATNAKGVYIAETYIGGFNYFGPVFNEVIKVDAYEGLVIKKLNGKLEMSLSSSRPNSGWQVKVRKPTRNYSH